MWLGTRKRVLGDYPLGAGLETRGVVGTGTAETDSERYWVGDSVCYAQGVSEEKIKCGF